MRCLTYFLAFAVALSCATMATAENIDFDLSDGTLNSNPPANIGPPDSYHSNPIILNTLLINPGETKGIWVTFKDRLHLEVIDDPSNSDGVERLVTHLNGRVIPDTAENDFTDLWVDVILSGTTDHIRESFKDPGSTHSDRPLLGNPDDPNFPDMRGDNSRSDDLTGDWDGAFDDSGTDLWDLFHEDVVVDKESHAVVDGFALETWADDLTDDHYLFHDIHWEITNHGPNPVEIFSAEFWQEGNIIRIGEWVPEPSSVVLVVMGLAGMGVRRRRS